MTRLTSLFLVLAGVVANFDSLARQSSDNNLPEIAGELVVVNKGSSNVHIINLSHPAHRSIIQTGREPHEVAVSPDGMTAVITDYGGQNPGNTLTVIDLESKKKLKSIELKGYRAPHGIDYLNNDHVVVTCEADQAVLLINVVTGKIEKIMKTGQQMSHMVVTDGADRVYVSSIGSGNLSVFDAKRGELLKHIETDSGAEGLDITPDGNEIWVANRAADNVTVIDAHALSEIETLSTGSFPIRVKITPDGSKVLISNARDGSITVFDAQSKQRLKTIALDIDLSKGLSPIGILPHPQAPYVFVANTTANEIIVVDLNKLKEVGIISTDNVP
ncbi:MAG: YncE family protein, partial [Fulvivirga sp.]|nr:YncE family protein [Fulvivirga sp.]